MAENIPFEKFSDLSYFDNLALFYICNETPPETLALAFLEGDTRVVGSMLGILEPKRRQYIHSLMAKHKNTPEDKKKQATSGLLIIAEGLLSRNLIEKKGKFVYGVSKK